MKQLKVFSFGAGVQSTALLLLMQSGEIPICDHIIFADTGAEPESVYENVERCRTIAADMGIDFRIVGTKSLASDFIRSVVDGEVLGRKRGNIPVFVKNADGSRGQLKRGCTEVAKISAVENEIKKILGIKTWKQAETNSVIQIFGISSDEIQRIRISSVRATTYSYPLVLHNTTSDKSPLWRRPVINRLDCLEISKENNINPPRSACVFCPYHSNAEWQRLKDDEPAEFARAVEFDERIRNPKTLSGQLFLHSSLVPLKDVDFTKHGSTTSFLSECVGMCGL